jgi:ectoine hydroxylase-related dioxygenase (phytanoyl-CoA dioxygenase family)
MQPQIAEFQQSIDDVVMLQDYPNAVAVEHNILIYSAGQLRSDALNKTAIQLEWAKCWRRGPGVLMIKGFFTDTTCVDAMSQVFQQILDAERHVAIGEGDHFAASGTNQRIWNALEKAAILAPAVFVDYYSNPLLGWAAEAWLGPGYQLTAQVNSVSPGGKAQIVHRDYHLGFQEDRAVARFPRHAQAMSAMLTLQGAIAHVDMAIASGPTWLLPFSQRYDLGYLLYRQPELIALFEDQSVQLPLTKGDAIFFSPALMHAAGANQTTEVQRLANLLQISSPFAKPMERLDHQRMQLALYNTLSVADLDEEALDVLATIISDSYPFPTNLDRDVPVGSITPTSGRDLLLQALHQGHDRTTLERQLQDYYWRRET